MISAQAQEIMDTLEKAQDRLVVWMATGFVTGFLIGFFAAWLLVRRL